MSATSHQIIAASQDADLRARVRALAAQQGLSGTDVDAAMSRLVGVSVPQGTGQTTLAAAYASAALTHRQAVEALPPVPGVNPAGVTDSLIVAALATLEE